MRTQGSEKPLGVAGDRNKTVDNTSIWLLAFPNVIKCWMTAPIF